MGGQCASPCSATSPGGFCPAGQTCIGGACCASPCSAACCLGSTYCVGPIDGANRCVAHCTTGATCGAGSYCAAIGDGSGGWVADDGFVYRRGVRRGRGDAPPTATARTARRALRRSGATGFRGCRTSAPILRARRTGSAVACSAAVRMGTATSATAPGGASVHRSARATRCAVALRAERSERAVDRVQLRRRRAHRGSSTEPRAASRCRWSSANDRRRPFVQSGHPCRGRYATGRAAQRFPWFPLPVRSSCIPSLTTCECRVRTRPRWSAVARSPSGPGSKYATAERKRTN